MGCSRALLTKDCRSRLSGMLQISCCWEFSQTFGIGDSSENLGFNFPCIFREQGKEAANTRPQVQSSDLLLGEKDKVSGVLGGIQGVSGRTNTGIAIKLTRLPLKGEAGLVDQGTSPDSTSGSLTNTTQYSFDWGKREREVLQ